MNHSRDSKNLEEFTSGDARVDALRTRPDLAATVAEKRAEIREADRVHALGLAMIRQAANLTQTEIAHELGVGQAAIAKLERRPDLLLSSLRSYVTAAGGRLRLIVELGQGREFELKLDG